MSNITDQVTILTDQSPFSYMHVIDSVNEDQIKKEANNLELERLELFFALTVLKSFGHLTFFRWKLNYNHFQLNNKLVNLI